MLIEDTRSRLPQGAQLYLAGKPRRLDKPVELALFRIAQEALRNVENHARATSATVALDFSEDNVRLSVTDDGLGFSPPENVSALSLTGKLGLAGMKERAELGGGRWARGRRRLSQERPRGAPFRDRQSGGAGAAGVHDVEVGVAVRFGGDP